MFARITIPIRLDGEVCDLCGSKEVATVFQTQGGFFPVQYMPSTQTYSDDGEWNACSPCAALIRAGERESLLRRSIAQYHAENNEPFRLSIQEMQGIFWRTLIGEAAT